MRRNQGFVLLSIAIVFVLLAGVIWYAYVQHESSKQQMLQQAAQDFLQHHKDGKFPAAPTAAEVWAAQEQRSARGEPKAPAKDPQRALSMGPRGQAQATASAGAFDNAGIALLLATLTALGFAGSTFRLAKQRGLARVERDRLAHELSSLRATGHASNGRPAPPWQEGALMMVRASTVPTVAYDLDARVLEVSEAFTRITGYTRVDIPDVKSWFTKALRTPASELDGALEAFRTKVRGGEIETRNVWTSAGEVRTWLCQPLEVWPLEGDALLLVARSTDVTAQAEAASAARTEADALRAAFNATEPAPVTGSRSNPAREAELAAQLASCAQECERLRAQARTLNERLNAEQAVSAALRAQDKDIAERTEARVGELEHAAMQTARLLDEAERLQAFAEHLEDGLWIADPRVPRIVYATPQVGKLRGRLSARMVEDFSEWTAAVHDDDRERVCEAFFAAGVEGSFNVEYRVLRDDGSIAWLHDRGVAVHDAHARLRHVIGICSDVTVRRNAEDAARIAVATLRTLIEDAPAMIWLKDAQGRYLYANRECEKVTGFSAEQLCGKTDFQVFARAAAERMHENDARVLAENIRQQFDEAFQCGDGLRHFAVLRFPARNSAASAGALCGLAFDITARRRSEDMLRADESRCRAIVSGLPQALLIVRENKVRYANAAAAELLAAQDAGALVGVPLQQFGAGPGTTMADAAKALSAEGSGRRRFTTRLKTGAGRELEVEVSAAAYETATERAVQFVVQDIAERNARLRALQEAEAFFRGLCEATPAAVRVLDAGARCNFATRGWQALSGSAAEGEWLQQVHPQDRDSVRSAYAKPARGEQPLLLEYRLGQGSGERWVLDMVLSRFDAQGQWKGFLSTAVDISERKRAEAAVRAHGEGLADLLDHCPALVWVADSGASGHANRACLTWLDAEVEQPAALDLGAHVHPEDLDAWTQARARHAHDRTPFEGVFRLRRGDGDYRRMRIAAQPVVVPGAGGARFVIVLDDVTESERVARALAVAEQRRAQVVALLGSAQGGELGQVRHSAELVRLMCTDEPALQQISARVLIEAQRLGSALEEMLVALRAHNAARAALGDERRTSS